MKVTITIDCDNAAFEEPAEEVYRILRDLASWVSDQGLHNRHIRDVNGNDCGYMKVTGK